MTNKGQTSWTQKEDGRQSSLPIMTCSRLLMNYVLIFCRKIATSSTVVLFQPSIFRQQLIRTVLNVLIKNCFLILLDLCRQKLSAGY